MLVTARLLGTFEPVARLGLGPLDFAKNSPLSSMSGWQQLNFIGYEMFNPKTVMDVQDVWLIGAGTSSFLQRNVSASFRNNPPVEQTHIALLFYRSLQECDNQEVVFALFTQH